MFIFLNSNIKEVYMFKFKSLYFAAIISLASNLAIASKNESNKFVQFPKKEVLRRSLYDAGLSHFVEKTSIEDIVDEELLALDVAIRLKEKLLDYNQYMQKYGQKRHADMVAALMQGRKDNILEILLQNDQQALDELEAAGLYKSEI